MKFVIDEARSIVTIVPFVPDGNHSSSSNMHALFSHITEYSHVSKYLKTSEAYSHILMTRSVRFGCNNLYQNSFAWLFDTQ